MPAKGDRIVVTYVLLKPEHIAAYQHALLTKHDFPVTPFAFPTRKRLVKNGPDKFAEDPDMKDLRLSGEQLTDMSSPPTRSVEEWEKHERNGHIPKFSDCPVCLEEQGPVVRHYAQRAPSLNTIHLDTGFWGDWSLDEKQYFIASALRVEQDKTGILIPFFVPVENKSAADVSREVFVLIDWISTCEQIQAFHGAKITRILSDQGAEFVNHDFETQARMRGIHLATSPAFQPQNNGLAERMEEAVQHANVNLSFFWIVSSAFSLHVECFLSIVVGVGDSQTMDEVCHVLISFNVALCAYVPVCLDLPSVSLCLHALPFFQV